MKYRTFLLFIALLALSCNEVDQTLLYGTWKGHKLSADGKEVDRGVEQVTFQFFPNSTYTYEVAHYKEAGTYRTVEDKLYTTDTLAQERLEKVVRIASLNADTLLIQMNKGGKEELLQCIKTQ